jgi:hypothetical protein
MLPVAVRGTVPGTAGRGHAPAGRSPAGTLPTAYHRTTGRHPGRCSAGADDDTHAHNTLSPDDPDVQVFYPFHPLHGATLRILRRPKRGDGAVCVIDPSGRRLKIPVWMLSRECAEMTISERPYLSKEALLSLATLIASQPDSEARVHDDLLQTSVSGCDGGHRGAASTSGPDDSKGMRRGVTGPSDTRRTHRSHGPRCSGGLSCGGGKQ